MRISCERRGADPQKLTAGHRMNDLLTEQPNSHASNIDQLSTLEMLEVINCEDMTVAQIVHEALPSIARAVEAIVGAFNKAGG